jgi:metal-responsive CopG/Arc/MetJ family transcriptional regulator
MSRERINVSLTEQGLEILDREREKMGLSRSAMFEVLLRFWIRDEPVVAQVGAAKDTSAPGNPRRRKQGKAAR